MSKQLIGAFPMYIDMDVVNQVVYEKMLEDRAMDAIDLLESTGLNDLNAVYQILSGRAILKNDGPSSAVVVPSSKDYQENWDEEMEHVLNHYVESGTMFAFKPYAVLFDTHAKMNDDETYHLRRLKQSDMGNRFITTMDLMEYRAKQYDPDCDLISGVRDEDGKYRYVMFKKIPRPSKFMENNKFVDLEECAKRFFELGVYTRHGFEYDIEFDDNSPEDLEEQVNDLATGLDIIKEQVDDVKKDIESLTGRPIKPTSEKDEFDERVEAQNREYQEALERKELIQKCKDQIVKQADEGEGWYEFDVDADDGTIIGKVRVPKAPFFNWALNGSAWSWEKQMAWDIVSPSGLKMINDDRFHTDWTIGAGLNIDELYDRDDSWACRVNMCAYSEKHRIQKEVLDYDFAVTVRPQTDKKFISCRIIKHDGDNELTINKLYSMRDFDDAVLLVVKTAGIENDVILNTLLKDHNVIIASNTGGRTAHLATVAREKAGGNHFVGMLIKEDIFESLFDRSMINVDFENGKFC